MRHFQEKKIIFKRKEGNYWNIFKNCFGVIFTIKYKLLHVRTTQSTKAALLILTSEKWRRRKNNTFAFLV